MASKKKDVSDTEALERQGQQRLFGKSRCGGWGGARDGAGRKPGYDVSDGKRSTHSTYCTETEWAVLMQCLADLRGENGRKE